VCGFDIFIGMRKNVGEGVEYLGHCPFRKFGEWDLASWRRPGTNCGNKDETIMVRPWHSPIPIPMSWQCIYVCVYRETSLQDISHFHGLCIPTASIHPLLFNRPGCIPHTHLRTRCTRYGRLVWMWLAKGIKELEWRGREGEREGDMLLLKQ